MDRKHERETLMCIGGPLSTKRLSVPLGLQWFSVPKEATIGAAGAGGVWEFESIVGTGSSVEGMLDESALPEDSAVYVRTRFVSGEKGLAEVFRCK